MTNTIPLWHDSAEKPNLIIDCVPFFQELDLLEIRMAELNNVVDYFVVVEADKTHKGDSKAFVFDPKEPRWSAYYDKIHYHQTTLPDGDGLPAIWRREIAQRNAIVTALSWLTNLDDSDIILISDCDEIPRPNAIPLSLPDGVILTYEQRLHYYTLNHYANAGWYGTRATTYGVVKALSPDGVRYASQSRGGFPAIGSIPNAGWHFSYFGGADAVRAKLGSFLHQELVNDQVRDLAHIQNSIVNGTDVYGRKEATYTIREAGEDIPALLKDEPERFAHFWLEYYTKQA